MLARPGLLRIAKETGDTVFLTVRANNNSICAEREIGDFPIKTLVVEVGDLRPLGIGSGSLAILSALPDAEIQRLLVHNAQALKAFPRFNRDEMLQHIAATRTRSYSLIDGQLVAGMSAIGVVIRDPAGQAIAAISVASIAPRLEGTRLDSIVDLVRGEAAQLEQTLIATQRRLPEQAMRARAAA
ncbi:MAG: hypothetical protein H0U13_12285 [Gemmatimonadaceae bacterium]|nr:hypothetical protein [Gemmatimonadaceae bacterium]